MMSFRHVLLVEDNPADARLLREVIADIPNLRIALTHAARLHEGLRLLSEQPFDMVLLDLSLPDAQGLETVEQVNAQSPNVPIIVMTGLDDEGMAERAIRAGAQDYLVKGQVDGQLLLRAIRYAAERKRAVEQLARSEEYWRAIFENSLDLICVLGGDGKMRFASPSHRRVLGYDPSELENTLIWKWMHPEDEPSARHNWETVVKQPNGHCVSEYRFCHRDGSWRYLEAEYQNMLHHPSMQGLVCSARDVSERRRSQLALEEAHGTLRAIVSTSPLAICALDSEGCVKHWNASAERILGWSEHDVLHNPLSRFLNSADDPHHESLEQAGRGEQLFGRELRLLKRDGETVDARVWTSLLVDGHQGRVGLVVVIADDSERKLLEEQFRQAQKMDAVGRLAGGIAHDFNNLLTVITFYCQMLLARLLPEDPLFGDMEQVLKAADRATALTKQLLAFSRRQVVQPKVLDLNHLLQDMVPMLRRLGGESVELRSMLQADLGPVRADPGQLEQVIVNLTVNARDAMPDGGRLILETANVILDEEYGRKHVSSLQGPHAMIAVSDTGTGMPPEVLKHLFEPFFTTKEKGKGTGLGLCTSYGIIKQNGGDIRVYSEVGIGTTFKIYLPHTGGLVEKKTHLPQKPLRRGSETLLVVEDEDGVRNVLCEMLDRQGYQVLAFQDSREALCQFAQIGHRIDLLLTDVVMPHVGGKELADQLRIKQPHLKVLFVSGYTAGAIVEHGLLEPGIGYLQKPFTQQDLAVKLLELFDGATNQ